MSRFNDETVPAAIRPYLQPGEQLRHWAYGVKQPNIFVLVALGVIATHLLTKHYICALTDRRFLVLRFGGNLNVKEVREYSLNPLPRARGSCGILFTHIRIDDPAKPFKAKFHRLGMANNREHSMAMVAALTGTAPADALPPPIPALA